MSIFNNLFDSIDDNKQIIGLVDELKMIYIYNLFEKKDNSILVVTNSLYEANKYYQALSNYTDEVLLFPMDDFLTSEALAISPELKNTRLETLNEILNNKKIVVTNIMGYLRYLPYKETYTNSIIKIKVASDYNIKSLIEDLYKNGYQRETIVNKTGEIAVRGYVLDVFPIGSNNPVRIEFWGDTVDSIRLFDVDTQRTIDEKNEISIYPNTEFLTDQYVDFEKRLQKDLCMYTNPVNISSYFDNVTIVYDDFDNLKTSYNNLLEEIYNYNISINIDANTRYMHDLYDLKNDSEIYFTSFDNVEDKQIKIEKYISGEIEPFVGKTEDINNKINTYVKNKKTVILCLSDRYKINKVIDNLNNNLFFVTNVNEINDSKINLINSKITSGFEFKNYVFISENELFHSNRKDQKYKTTFKYGTRIKDIAKLNPGDYVVHSMYGIGKYIGISTLNKNGLQKDYLQVQYKNNDKLYIPVEKIELISKYSSNENVIPKINSLNSTEWEKTKLRVKKKIENMAGELLKLYAKREASVGFEYHKDTEEQSQFEKEFPFKETLDQLKVVEEIKKDMESLKPMDRLLCGDVGYGKTEVAFRVMFKAVMSGKQVALLCPTTILSNQHYTNALERFKNFPINICLLNRFVSKKNTEQLKKKIKDGRIDIVIGTHRILSNDIEFKNLGLLVVDEEQRFGVKHKEKIKEYKNNIDILTLSATPIPRTLQMSMAGIRNLSLIETPPIDRYPIQTYVVAENGQIIKDAIYKELSRNGQVFILYNHIDNMSKKINEISKLVPDAKIISAHGKMDKTELENVMIKFINKEYNVLICTTIIETGIDIPSANTLIIMEANNFGLSQLYQIRGRVGRSNKIAYCYLTYNKDKVLSEVAIKRLKAIKEFTELGSGFKIAMRDLSIRGAGDILGSEQAGFIDSIGIELFMKMLDEEINILKGIENPKEDIKETTALIEVDTSIESDYVADEDIKIIIHQKINSIDSFDKLIEIKEELEDRFGIINEKMLIYMHEEWFEKLARSLGITKVRQTKNFIEIILNHELTEKINGENLFFEVSKLSRMYRFSLKMKCLVITLDTVKLERHFIYYLIELLELIKKNLK